MDIRLDGRTALITGGSMGLGLAMAKTFAHAGAAVAIAARRREVLDDARSAIAKGAGTKVKAYVCDVTKAQDIAALYGDVVMDFGQVDILVNNAGQSATGVFEDISDDAWQSDIDLKLLSTIRLTRAAFSDMKARRWGRVINVLNSAAKAPGGRSAPTSVTRAAGLALTKVLAHEGAPHNVLVNAICPGLFMSDQWERKHKPGGPVANLDARLAKLGQQVPLGRVGEAQEFANLACFLASDAASYITGSAINADGGLTPVP